LATNDVQPHAARGALHDVLDALPPLVHGPAAEDVERRFASYWAATLAGNSFTAALRSKPAFSNPYCLEEALTTFGIDDRGTAFPAGLWDPHALPPSDSYDALAIRQAMEEEARKVRLASRGAVEFVTPHGAGAGGNAGGDGVAR
jgi:hypothetical protein